MEKENNERKKEKGKNERKEVKENENWLKIETRNTLSCLSAELLAFF